MFGQFEEPHVDPWPMAGDIWGSSCNIQALGKHLDGGCQWENYKKWHWSLSFEHLNDDLSYAIISSIFHPFSSLSIHCSSICHPFFIHFSSIWPFVPTTFVFCCSQIIRRAAWSLKIPPLALGRTSWAQQKRRFCKLENGHRKFVDLPMKNAKLSFNMI